MFRIVEGNTHGLRDAAEFIDRINRPPKEHRSFFEQGHDIFVARAPGRLDVMGGIADYSGSLVLQMPIAEATFAAVQRSMTSGINIVSVSQNPEKNLAFEMQFSQMRDGDDGRVSYAGAREFFRKNISDHWASYVAGVPMVLERERGIEFQEGIKVLIWSRVPVGKGVSSSAALEVASMQAICAAFDIDIEPREMALLCQLAENKVVGAPCGVMDQIASNCGVKDALISILCQPAEIQGRIEMPDEIEFWGIDSGVRHAVTGCGYTSVRIGAFMGYRIIADLVGLKTEVTADGSVFVEDPQWNGYLCNIEPSEYEGSFAARIPETISGAKFIENYGGSTDRVTRIDSDLIYPVRAPTEHGIYENSRVGSFANLLRSENLGEHLDELGNLMFQSHASYAACGLNESGTDRIVELVREKRDRGLFGARITGGGSGGTVAILATRGSEQAIAEIARIYQRETGLDPYIFHGSSPGSSAFGAVRVTAGVK